MRIAVTGATGYVGSFIVRHLLEAGHDVQALVRPKEHHRHLPQDAKLKWVPGSLEDEASLRAVASNCDGAVHAAFEHVAGKYRGGEGDSPDRFRSLNVECSERFLELLRDNGVKRTVFLSSRAVYDGIDSGADLIEDDTTPVPVQLYGETKATMERVGFDMPEIGFCSVRATGIYGLVNPIARSKWFDLVEKAVLQGSDGSNFNDRCRTEVHGEDVASAIAILLTSNRAQVAGRAFNCSDVAISDAQLVALVDRLQVLEEPLRSALPRSEPANNPMSCESLRALGWRPGGMPKLIATLRLLVRAIHGTASQD